MPHAVVQCVLPRVCSVVLSMTRGETLSGALNAVLRDISADVVQEDDVWCIHKSSVAEWERVVTALRRYVNVMHMLQPASGNADVLQVNIAGSLNDSVQEPLRAAESAMQHRYDVAVAKAREECSKHYNTLFKEAMKRVSRRVTEVAMDSLQCDM